MKSLILTLPLILPFFLFAQINESGLPLKEAIKIYPLDAVNSNFRDVNLSITPNGKYLYFMSGRGGTVWSVKDKVKFRGKTEYDGDIWYSEKKDTTWQSPRYLPADINTSKGEDEPNISPDGQTVYFQSWNAAWLQTGGPYYRAELYGKRWQNPVGLYGGIHQFFKDSIFYYQQYATDGMAISPNGRIFIVAAGEIYDGNLDLYISRRDRKGNWSYPERLNISTKKDERSIFIAGDNKTIYFGSDGHGGEGGLDIFKATLQDDNTCTDIVNIGAPFNTKKDDYGFIIGALGHDAYFVRNSDIYYANLGASSDFIKPQPTILLNGIVKDCDGKTTQAQVELYNVLTNELLAKARSNAVTGEYAFSMLRTEGKYAQRFQFVDNQEVRSIVFDVDASTDEVLNFEVQPICEQAKPMQIIESEPVVEPLDTTILVYFDFDKFDLKASEQAKLEEIAKLIEDKRRYFAEIVGHTDSKGSDAYNIQLSQRRAETVKNYIKSFHSTLALDGNLSVQFKGESEPVMDNTTTANRAKNRRVLLRIADALE